MGYYIGYLATLFTDKEVIHTFTDTYSIKSVLPCLYHTSMHVNYLMFIGSFYDTSAQTRSCVRRIVSKN